MDLIAPLRDMGKLPVPLTASFFGFLTDSVELVTLDVNK
jgi:hypothetical protein